MLDSFHITLFIFWKQHFFYFSPLFPIVLHTFIAQIISDFKIIMSKNGLRPINYTYHILKKFRQNLIGNKLAVEGIAGCPYFLKVIRAHGKNIQWIGLFVNQFFAFKMQFIHAIRFHISQKNTFLNSVQTGVFAVSILVLMDVDQKLTDVHANRPKMNCFNPCFNGCRSEGKVCLSIFKRLLSK